MRKLRLNEGRGSSAHLPPPPPPAMGVLWILKSSLPCSAAGQGQPVCRSRGATGLLLSHTDRGDAGETPIELKGSGFLPDLGQGGKNLHSLTSFVGAGSLPPLPWLTSPPRSSVLGPGNRWVLELRINQKAVGRGTRSSHCFSRQPQAKVCFHCSKGDPAILVSPEKQRRFDILGLNRRAWPRRPAPPRLGRPRCWGSPAAGGPQLWLLRGP